MNFTIRGISTITAIAVAGPLMAAGPMVSPLELNEMLAEGDVILLDVRGPASEGSAEVYAEAHIPGAIYVPMTGGAPWRKEVNGVPFMLPSADEIQAFAREMGIDNDTPVVIYGTGTPKKVADLSSATRAYWTLKVMGHDEVSILNGGIESWKAAGLPTAMSATEPKGGGNFTAEFQPEIHVDLATFAAAVENGGVNLVDSRPHAQYTGESKSGIVNGFGTVPGAVNAYAAMLMDGGELMGAEAIRVKMASIGVEPNEPAYTFCNGGFYCSAMWFAMKEVAGFSNVKVYDGSMSEYTQDGTRELVPGADMVLSSAN
jgi:thiosulfate/3-mercaptopyruvate sulfurtransferase